MIDPGAILALSMFAAACALLLAGYPVAFTLGGTAILFALIGFGLEYGFATPIPLDMGYLALLPDRIFGTIMNDTLLAIPLFVVMGVMLERSRVAEELLETMAGLFGRLRGGLGLSVIIVGGLLAASTGIVGATVVTMGLLSLPTMLKRGYDPALASGAIAASGTLGQIIPPSIALVLLGDVLSSANQEAQRALGNLAPDPLSVGELFAGALIPGLALAGLYCLWLALVAWLRPDKAPALTDDGLPRPSLGRLLRALAAPVVLILSVLGSILSGVATPTEAAAIGAIGAILLGAIKLAPQQRWPGLMGFSGFLALLALAMSVDLRPGIAAPLEIGAALALTVLTALGILGALWQLYRLGTLLPALRQTVLITTMVFTILIGAALFSLVFRGLGGDEAVHHGLMSLPGGALGAMIVVMLVMFVLGFFLDFIEIVFVVVPIVAPVLLKMGIDPLWLGIMMAVNLQTSFLTPPFGFALFYLRGVAPPEVTTGMIYRGIIPFVAIQLLMLVILALAPAMATWLPRVIFG